LCFSFLSLFVLLAFVLYCNSFSKHWKSSECPFGFLFHTVSGCRTIIENFQFRSWLIQNSIGIWEGRSTTQLWDFRFGEWKWQEMKWNETKSNKMKWRDVIWKHSDERILMMNRRIEWWDDSMFNLNIITSFWFSIILLFLSLTFVSTNHFEISWGNVIDIHTLTISSLFEVQELFKHIQHNHTDMTIIDVWFKIRNEHEISLSHQDNDRYEWRMLHFHVMISVNSLSKFEKQTVTISQIHL
jgi:hypothetical protein